MSKARELIILLIFVGFIAYFPSLFGGFVWDDEDFVYNNIYVKEQQIGRFFTENAIAGAGKDSNYYRPAQFSLYALLYRTAGLNPFPYHLAGLVLHVTATILAFVFLTRLTKQTTPSFLAALFFLIHPIQTESVSYVSGLSDALYSIFFFLTLILFINARNKPIHFIVGAIAFIIALLSKELALILPGILVLIGLIYPEHALKKRLVLVGTYALIALSYLVARFTFLSFFDTSRLWKGSVYGTQFLVRFATFFHNFFTYVSLLIFPNILHMERDYTTQIHESLWNAWTLLFVLLVGGCGLMLVINRNKAKHALFFYLSFLTSLLPFTGVFLLNGIFYEHYIYLPMLFFWAFVFFLIEPLLTKKIGVWIVIIVSCLFVARSYVRQWEWIDAERFYRQTLQYAPKSVRILNGLGMTLAEKGECDEAVVIYKRAIQVDSKIPNPYHNIANCMKTQRKYQQAETYYKKAISVSPGFHFSYSSLLNLYLESGQQEKAKELIEKDLLKRFPDNQTLKRIYQSL